MPTCLLRSLLCVLALTTVAATRLAAQVSPLWADVTPAYLPQQNGYANLSSVDFGNNIFVASGYLTSAVVGDPELNFVFTSPDGVNWTQHDGAPSGGRVRFANGNFYLSTLPNPDSFLYASPDGIVWNRVADLGKNADGISDIAFGNGLYVMARPVDDPIDDSPLPTVSSDLTHWTAHTVGNTAEYTSLTHVAFVNGRFILAGSAEFGASAYTSTDGANWSASAPAEASGGYDYIAAGNGVALLPSGYHDLQVSTDGLAWTAANPGLYIPNIYGITEPVALLYARFINGQFVGAANTYDQKTINLYASADAQNWTRLGALPSNYAVSDLAFGNGVYVAVTTNGIYSVKASAVTPVAGKFSQVGGTIKTVTTKLKAQKSTQVISGTFTLTNTGTQAARNVQVSVFLSDDKVLDTSVDTPGRVYLGTLSLADVGYPRIGKNGKSAGPVPFKFHTGTYNVPTTTGKYLLVFIDPQQYLNEGDRTGDVIAYGPLP